MHYSNGKAFSLMCGKAVSECTRENLLKYIRSKSNGQVTYDIYFKETDKRFIRAGNKTFVPMN